MAADDTAIGFAKYRMQMQSRALIPDRDIAEQRQDLDLLVDRNFLCCLAAAGLQPPASSGEGWGALAIPVERIELFH